jgi:hypothetical protein
MNPHDLEQQEKLQAAAERAEREHLPAGDPQVDAYRLVWRALRQPLPVALPDDFAQQVVRRLQSREEAAQLEQWLTRLLVVILAVAAAVFALPPMARVLAPLVRATAAQPVPWSLVFVAALGMAAVWLTDLAVSGRRTSRQF